MPNGISTTDLVSNLEVLRHEAVQYRNALSSHFSALPPTDPRVGVARHIKASISSAYLASIFLDQHLRVPGWWMATFKRQFSQKEVQDDLDDFTTQIASNVIVTTLSLFEAGLRRILRAIDPTAADGAAGEFINVYTTLLKRLEGAGWGGNRGEAIELLDLYRTVRNTIHNNGAYYSKKATDQKLTWQGQPYVFVHGSVPAFTDWSFNIKLVSELIKLNDQIMRAPLVMGLAPIP
jgi:hypothetical protein